MPRPESSGPTRGEPHDQHHHDPDASASRPPRPRVGLVTFAGACGTEASTDNGQVERAPARVVQHGSPDSIERRLAAQVVVPQGSPDSIERRLAAIPGGGFVSRLGRHRRAARGESVRALIPTEGSGASAHDLAPQEDARGPRQHGEVRPRVSVVDHEVGRRTLLEGGVPPQPFHVPRTHVSADGGQPVLGLALGGERDRRGVPLLAGVGEPGLVAAAGQPADACRRRSGSVSWPCWWCGSRGCLLAVRRPRFSPRYPFRGNSRLDALGTLGHDARRETPKWQSDGAEDPV